MFRGTKLSPTMVDTKSSQEEFGWFVNELAGHYFGPRKPSWRFVKACLACAIVVPPVFYELFQVDLIEKAGYGWLRPFTYGFGFDNIWRMFVASRRLQLYQPPSDTPGFVEAGPVWKLLEDPKSLPYDDNFRAILAKSRQGKTTAAIHGANVNCGVKKCIPFLRFYVSVLKPQYWGNAAAEQESWVYVRVQRGLRDDLAHLLSVTEEHDFSNLLLKALEPSPFSLLRLPWSQYFLLPARITLIFDQLDDAHGRWRDNFDEALSVSHVPRLAKHNNIPACRLIGLIKNEESANVFERTNGGTLRCVPLGPWSEEDLRKVPTVRPSWESRRTFVRLPSGEVLEAPVYCSDPKRPTAVKVVQFVEQHLGTTVRFKDFVPDTWASSDVASTPLILRMTQVRLPTGDCIAAPFCPNGSQSCAVAVAEILSSHVGRPVRPGELIGDWATSDAVPLRLRGATKVVMPLGDVMPFPYCAGSDQMCAFELAQKLGRHVGHAVRPGELMGDWATSDVVPLRLRGSTKVVLPDGEEVAFPYCAASNQMCALELTENLGRRVGHAVRPGELIGDWATSDVVPLRLRGATKVVLPLGDVMPFPYCAGSDQMCAFELAEKLGRYVGHAVRPGELKGDWATSDVVPLRLHPPVKSWPSLFGIPASSASTSV